MAKPHLLAVPLPAQGHVLPLMEFSLCLAKQGLRITFVNTEFIHERLVNALMERDSIGEDRFRLVSISDGLTDAERKISGKLSEAIWGSMREKLEELIETIRRSGDDVNCVVADRGMGSALEVAAKMGIRRAAFCPIAAVFMPLAFSIPKMITDGTIDIDGTPMKDQEILFLPIGMNTKDFPWVRNGDLTKQKHLFKLIVRNNEAVKKADRLICNSAYDLEPAVFDSAPDIIPVGPLLARNRLGDSDSAAGSLWPADPTCLEWLDQHPPCSVIYVAFGSTTFFNEKQFQELAMGLELCNMPFLWVVRENVIMGGVSCSTAAAAAYPAGFQERLAGRVKVVSWAPQQKVLSHPSIACFLSHCGWNSTIEGVSNGVPFLCWPYAVDQFMNERYICDVWKIGLGFNIDQSGIVSREDIKCKVEQLLGDRNFRERALNLKESAMNCVREGGSSYNNLHGFIHWLKA